MRGSRKLTDRFLLLVITLTTTALPFMGVPSVHAANPLDNRYDKLSTSIVSAVAIHEIGFQYTNTAVPVGSVSFEFCSNSPLIAIPCVAPSGLDATNVSLNNQSGETGYAIDPGSTANRIVLSRPAAVPAGAASVYRFSNIINPDYLGTFFLRLQTYTSTDGTGLSIEDGGIALTTTNQFVVQTEVPPYLTLCVAAVIAGTDCSTATTFLVELGEFSTTATANGTSNIVIATNAANGYSVTLSGSTLTSGNNTVTPLSPGGASNPGTNQFGMNLRQNTNPGVGADPAGGAATATAPYNIPNLFRFQNGDVIATAPQPSDFTKLTVSYIVNISNAQPPGYYASTFTYICLANF